MLLKPFVILIMTYQWFLLCGAKDNVVNNSLSNTVNDKKRVCINPVKFSRHAEKETKKSSHNPAEKKTAGLNLAETTSPKNTSIRLYPNATANREMIIGHEGRYLTKLFPMTCDGYLLTVFHLTFEHHISPSKKRPVLLVHGMFQSSDRFLQQSANQSLAFKLQDLGYDVWVANVRGNKYSRHHIYLDPDDDMEKNEFSNYSFEEIGYYDIAATVDTIRNWTVYEKIHFIGHSLGGTAFLVLNSLKPEYNAFFDVAFLLAPLAYQRYFPHYGLKRDLYDLEIIHDDLLKAGVVEIFPLNSTEKNQTFSPGSCLGDKKYEHICSHMAIQKIMNLNSDFNTRDNTRGGSIKQLIHLAQNVHSGSFRRWHYKEEKENDEKYGQKTPPEYNLSLVIVPTTIFYSTGDEYVARRDIEVLAKKMANATIQKVAKKNFKHDDYISAPDVMTAVYNHIINKFPENPHSINDGKPSYEAGGIASSFVKYIPRILVGTVVAGLCVFVVIHLHNTLHKSEPDRRTET